MAAVVVVSLIQKFLILAFDYIKIYYNLDNNFTFFHRCAASKNGAQAATDNRTVYKATVTSHSI
jgi:hypothetical protein